LSSPSCQVRIQTRSPEIWRRYEGRTVGLHLYRNSDADRDRHCSLNGVPSPGAGRTARRAIATRRTGPRVPPHRRAAPWWPKPRHPRRGFCSGEVPCGASPVWHLTPQAA
jgi:hypothetical protein